jgi:hypothetical protein
MNKRIRELALQAGEYVNSVYTPPIRSKTPGKIWEDGHVGWNEQFQAKFAELIVRECIDIAYEYDAPKLSGPGMIIGNRIQEHFGVTE